MDHCASSGGYLTRTVNPPALLPDVMGVNITRFTATSAKICKKAFALTCAGVIVKSGGGGCTVTTGGGVGRTMGAGVGDCAETTVAAMSRNRSSVFIELIGANEQIVSVRAGNAAARGCC